MISTMSARACRTATWTWTPAFRGGNPSRRLSQAPPRAYGRSRRANQDPQVTPFPTWTPGPLWGPLLWSGWALGTSTTWTGVEVLAAPLPSSTCTSERSRLAAGLECRSKTPPSQRTRVRNMAHTHSSQTDTSPGTPESDTYTIGELAAATGIPVRTIRYYLHRGLLPSPPFRGPRTVYSEHHRKVLELIERLHGQGLSLEAIARVLEPLGADAVDAALEGKLSLVYFEQGSSESQPPPAAPPLVPQPRPAETWELAPGLFLLLSGEAPAGSRALARRLLQQRSNCSLQALHGGGTVARERKGEKD